MVNLRIGSVMGHLLGLPGPASGIYGQYLTRLVPVSVPAKPKA